MREYQRRVRLYENTTTAGRLVERMTGNAWKATETLDLAKLKCESGVQILLDHLWAELEPLEFVRVLKTLHEFYEKFQRSRSQDFISYDTAFRTQLRLLEEVGAGLGGLTKRYWYLSKANINDDLRQKVVSATGGSYEYEKLRDALAAISPSLNKSETSDEKSGNVPNRHWKARRNDHRVHIVGGGNSEDDEDFASIFDRIDELTQVEALEQEAEILMTQAARKRSMVEKARGFQKGESADERSKRIASMKQRMACNACRGVRTLA